MVAMMVVFEYKFFMKIRLAQSGDLETIVDIYNEAILETVATFDTEIKTIESQQEWFDQHRGKYPLFVCEIQKEIVGWASLKPWSDRCAYSDTAENSVYLFKKYHGKGLGKALMQVLVKHAEDNKIHTIISRISDGNEASLKLHRQFGFQDIGVMKEVGRKFGRLIDVHLMQRIF